MQPKIYVGVLMIRFRAKVRSREDLISEGQKLAAVLPSEVSVEAWDVDQVVEVPPIPIGYMGLQLCSVGNPDYGQFSPPSLPEFMIVKNLREARDLCEDYKTEWNLGGGNWGNGSGVVRDTAGKIIALFSYNLRCWSPEGGQEIEVGEGD